MYPRHTDLPRTDADTSGVRRPGCRRSLPSGAAMARNPKIGDDQHGHDDINDDINDGIEDGIKDEFDWLSPSCLHDQSRRAAA